MTVVAVVRAVIATAVVIVVLMLVGAAAHRAFRRDVRSVAADTRATTPSAPEAASRTTHPAAEIYQGYIFGRITTWDGGVYEGRLRWNGNEEAFWDDPFNAAKVENPWLAKVPPERLPKGREPIHVFGFPLGERDVEVRARRPFMARFGDIVRIDAHGRGVRVTLKSGSVFDLDRFEASDFDDNVTAWDVTRGVVDLRNLRLSTIEFLPTPRLSDAPYRLQGTVRTRSGEFSGFVGWNRDKGVGTDELVGHAAEGELHLRLDTIRAIERRSRATCLVTLQDGRELLLSGSPDVGDGHRGISVNDPRYGRVLIPFEIFERAEFTRGGSGLAYSDFLPGSSLIGRVATGAGISHAGRLVFDLDESETTETLDAPWQGVDYSIPFGLIASIVPGSGARPAIVTLHGGEQLKLDSKGDLASENGGMLIFGEERSAVEYVPWADIGRLDLDAASAVDPPPSR